MMHNICIYLMTFNDPKENLQKRAVLLISCCLKN